MKVCALDRLKRRRKLWLSIHLWLGLILGLFLAMFGITGSILVFQEEIDEWLNPTLLTVSPASDSAPYKPLADIFEAGRTVVPDNAKHSFAYYPRNGEAAFKLDYRVARTPELTETWQVYVDPYSARVLGKRLMASSDSSIPKTFIGFVFELHYALLLGETVGYPVVGIMGALLILSVLTGMIVWWPLTGKWRQALTIKARASVERLNFDLHKTFGFYTIPVMLPVLFSGIYMNLPQYVAPVIELFSPVTYRYWFESTPIRDTAPITMAQAVALADNRFPGGRTDLIYGAPGVTDTYTVCKHDVVEPGSLLTRRCVVLDRYTGKLLDVDDPATGTGGEVFTQWQWPLHSGRAFGWTGRILVFLTGIACPVLCATGFIRWLQKRRSNYVKMKKVCRINPPLKRLENAG